jgi:hypothetical protein
MSARRAGGVQIPAGSTSLPTSIDGALAPAAIPDRVAYRHFMVAAMMSASDPLSRTRQTAMLRNIALSDADHASVVKVLAATARQLESLDPLSSTFSGLRNAAFDTARDEMDMSLSVEGLSRLHEYLQRYIKPRIKIYGEIPR